MRRKERNQNLPEVVLRSSAKPCRKVRKVSTAPIPPRSEESGQCGKGSLGRGAPCGAQSDYWFRVNQVRGYAPNISAILDCVGRMC